MDFVKMEGLGNDFVVLSGPADVQPGDVAAWCDRRRGIGADGVLIVEPVDQSTVAMRYWNADGSPAEMCGNGLRCVTKYAVDTGLIDASEFEVRTAVGTRRAEVVDAARYRVELGPTQVGEVAIDLAGFRLDSVDVGNPHAVTFVDDCYVVPVDAVGPVVEGDPAYPNRTNVEFATVARRDRLALRVWERGVGETLACGTGAAAAVAAGVARDLLDPTVEVVLPGGELLVEIIDGTAWITGPARTVYRGTFEG